MEFAHLHCHTEASFLDAMCRSKELAQRTAELGMSHVAITDHGVMFNVVQFYQRCKEAGVSPIVGCEIYVAPGCRKQRRRVNGDAAFHMLALCKDEQGYRNLVRLVSHGYIDGYYTKPRVDDELLDQYRDGLIITSSCLSGEICRHILRGETLEARRRAARLLEIFGRDNFYIELQRHGIPEQDAVLPELVRIARELKVDLVATNDVHYLRQEDARSHEVFLCIQDGMNMNSDRRRSYGPPNFYLRSPAEMSALFSDLPEAVENSLRIARRCAFEFDFSRSHLPRFETPEGETPESWLEKLCREAIPTVYGAHTQEVEDRLKYELDVIAGKGYSSYFLIVHDFVRFARSQGIMSQARGSAAGSLVSYLLGLTTIDPLRYRLLFERFLNPERKSMPDIDLDFADDRREEVIQYCRDRYGKDHVAQIVAFGTMGARAAVRDSARALALESSHVDRVVRLIPDAPGTQLNSLLTGESELNKLYRSDEAVKGLIDTARSIEGLYRHRTVHAAGVVITDEPIINYAPVCTLKEGQEGLAIQYEMGDAEKIGLVKMDFLGLRNLTVVDKCVRLLRDRGVEIDVERLPLDDAATYALLQEGRTVGVFQLESAGMRRLLKQVRPDRLEDLISVVAIFRPGPLQNGYDTMYVRRKHGQEAVSYPHPLLEPVLDYTYGVILFQEQVMQITQVLAGFSPGKAEQAMKAMSKKQVQMMAELKPEFISGAEQRGVPRAQGEKIFDQLASFAQYGFGLNHSAAYALLSFVTAYLKANYPHEFMACNLTSMRQNRDRLALYISDTAGMGIALGSPCVNRSKAAFSVDYQNGQPASIRIGLDGIKGLGSNLVHLIIQERDRNGPYKSFWDFVDRMSSCDSAALTSGSLEILIKAGCLDGFGADRAQLLQMVDRAAQRAENNRRRARSGIGSLFDDLLADEPEMPSVAPMHPAEKLRYERELIGMFTSGNPLRGFEENLRRQITHNSEELRDLRHDQDVTVGGAVWSIVADQTRQGRRRVRVELTDGVGTSNVVFFPSGEEEPVSESHLDQVVVVRGRAQVRNMLGPEGGSTAEVEVRGKSVQLLSRQAAPRARTMHLELSQGRRCDLLLLQQLLKQNAGMDIVVYHIGERGAETPVLNPARVAISDRLLREAEAVMTRLGGRVWID